MTGKEIQQTLEKQTVVTLAPDGFAALLESAITVREGDTRMSGWIRIFESDGAVLLQEETPKGEILLRKMVSIQDAEVLLKSRLDTYERMWDGCGCKIDYYA